MIGIMAFIDIPNHKGFGAIGMLFTSIILFLLGTCFVCTLGRVVNNNQIYVQNQERNKKEDVQCQSKIL